MKNFLAIACVLLFSTTVLADGFKSFRGPMLKLDMGYERLVGTVGGHVTMIKELEEHKGFGGYVLRNGRPEIVLLTMKVEGEKKEFSGEIGDTKVMLKSATKIENQNRIDVTIAVGEKDRTYHVYYKAIEHNHLIDARVMLDKGNNIEEFAFKATKGSACSFLLSGLLMTAAALNP